MSVFSSIVCCLNLSENPDVLVQYVNDIAKQNDAKIIFVQVAAGRGSILNRSSVSVDSIISENVEKANSAFSEYVKKNVEGEAVLVFAEGDTDKELLKVVDKYCADLIIVGSMSTKCFMGGWFSNPSDSIIGKTRVPVMVIPNDFSLECTPDF
jgi:nucleotide-binding universal stress UspA family protein